MHENCKALGTQLTVPGLSALNDRILLSARTDHHIPTVLQIGLKVIKITDGGFVIGIRKANNIPSCDPDRLTNAAALSPSLGVPYSPDAGIVAAQPGDNFTRAVVPIRPNDNFIVQLLVSTISHG